MVHNVKLGKNMRSVSIVGIGATPFFNGVQNETYKGLTNGELFGHAALDAMKDAGVEPRIVWNVLCDHMNIPDSKRWGKDHNAPPMPAK